MRKPLILLAAVIAITATGAGAPAAAASPGLISASSPLYPADVAVDNIQVAVGLESNGDIAAERAAEAQQAMEEGDEEAADEALENLNNSIAEVATADSTGLQKAEAILGQLAADNPDNNQGITKALDAVRSAKDRSEAPDEAGQGDKVPAAAASVLDFAR